MNQANILVLVISAIILGAGLFSGAVRSSVVSGPMIALSIGVILGPAAGVLRISEWGDQYWILQQVAKFALAIALMGSAFSLPRYDILNRWRALAVLLGLAMPLAWLTSGALIYWILGLPVLPALVTGAAVSPTDPILARTVVEGELARKNIPEKIRYLLLDESGINDGLGEPFVMIVLLLMLYPLGPALKEWSLRIVLQAIVGGVLFGLLMGWTTGTALGWARRHERTDRSFAFIYPAALSLAVVALGEIIGVDGVLAVFFAGLAFAAQVPEDKKSTLDEVQSGIDHLTTVAVFLVFGLMLPWEQWPDYGWNALAIVAAVLALRRLPFVLAFHGLMKRQVRGWHQAAFLGWFGPIGVSALYYATLEVEKVGTFRAWHIVSLLVCASTVAHAATASFWTRRRLHADGQES